MRLEIFFESRKKRNIFHNENFAYLFVVSTIMELLNEWWLPVPIRNTRVEVAAVSIVSDKVIKIFRKYTLPTSYIYIYFYVIFKQMLPL